MINRMLSYFLCILLLQIGWLQADESSSIVNYCSTILNTSPENIIIEKFNGGVSNRAYLLSTPIGEEIVAKIFTKRSLDDVYRIEQIVSALRQIGFQIPETLTIVPFQNKFPLHISRFEKGPYVTDDDLPRIAKLMAELHIKGSSITPSALERYKGE